MEQNDCDELVILKEVGMGRSRGCEKESGIACNKELAVAWQ